MYTFKNLNPNFRPKFSLGMSNIKTTVYFCIKLNPNHNTGSMIITDKQACIIALAHSKGTASPSKAQSDYVYISDLGIEAKSHTGVEKS